MFCPKCGTQNVQTVKFCRNCGANLGNVSEALAGNIARPQPMLDKKGKPVKWEESAITKIFTGLAFLIIALILGITGVAGGKFWWFWMLIPAFGSLGSGIAQYIQLRRNEQNISFASNDQNVLNSNFSTASLPPASTNQNEIQSLLAQGRKIEAIKVFRETYNVGLKEAKDAVEAMERGQMPLISPQNFNNVPLPANQYDVQDLIKQGRKIEAIKVYREIYGVGLKEAKDAVEEMERNHSSMNFRGNNEPPRGSIYDTGELTAPPSVTENTTRHLEMDSEGETMNLPKSNL